MDVTAGATESVGDDPEPAPEPEPAEPTDLEEGVPPPTQLTPETLVRAQSGPPFPNVGISLEGLELILSLFSAQISEDTTTSDMCHAIIKPQTAPPGWVCEPELINAEKRWYNHRYVNVADPSITADQAPPGTRSFLQKLAADPQTAHFVGVPTVFLSHAWTYKFRNVITAIRNYVEALPARAPQPFFWFDCLSIDEHATQSLTQEWWSTTFQDAIRDIGATLMVLSPWDNPLPLTRAWCLWELFSTHKVDATFHICLGPEEQRAFEHAITHDSGVVLQAFADINVKNAEAGSQSDQDMIRAAVEESVGFDGLNRIAFDRMRVWILDVARALLPRADVQGRNQIASMFDQLGLHAEAGAIIQEALAKHTQRSPRRFFGFLKCCGSKPVADVAAAATYANMAGVHDSLGDYPKALELYEQALQIQLKALGPNHASVATTYNNMAVVHNNLGDYPKALELYEQALQIQLKALGPNHAEVAITYANTWLSFTAT